MGRPIVEIPTGNIYGRLTVQRLDPDPPKKKAYYICSCSCGGSISVRGTTLRQGRANSCGCLRVENARRAVAFRKNERSVIPDGTRFNRLVIAAFERWNPRTKRSIYLCKCDCGNECLKDNVRLESGKAESCGCLWKERIADKGKRARTHGMSRTPEYRAWTAMRRRCSNPSCGSYRDYGGRGIMVCYEWQKSFASFIKDVGLRPSDAHSLDRIDVNKNYEPGNVRWATTIEQANNKRAVKRIELFTDQEILDEIKRRGLTPWNREG